MASQQGSKKQRGKDTGPAKGGSDRRSEIVQIAAEIFAEMGFNGTTIRQIAERADMLSGSLYYHFESKESIADEIISAYFSDLFLALDEVLAHEVDASTRLQMLIHACGSMFSRHESGVRLLLNDWPYLIKFLPDVPLHMSRLEDIWTEVIAEGMDQGVFRSDLSPVLVYRTIMSAISGTCRWYQPGGKIPIEETFGTMTALFLDGARVEHGAVPTS